MPYISRLTRVTEVIQRLLNNIKVGYLNRNDLLVRRNIFRLYTVMKKPLPKLFWLSGAAPILNSISDKGLPGVGKPQNVHSLREIIKKADELYMNNEVELLYNYLYDFRDSEEAEILWRIARAFCDKAKLTKDAETRKRLMYEAFAYAKSALKAGENNFACHKWYAILIDYVAEYQGTKARLQKAFEIKEHFLRAIELNEKDATSYHLLGHWCFVFADLSWYQKKLASVIFATPPVSTYQEALGYCLKAEEIEEGFYSMNLLLIGKTYLRLKERELAKHFLSKTVACDAKTEDDKKAIFEATNLLKSL